MLRLAGAIDASDQWVGGALVVIQVGDQLDRGDGEREILTLFERLREQASLAGGAFYALNGNHEVMNVQADFRYVTPGGFRAFDGTSPRPEWAGLMARVPPTMRGRVAAFAPGGIFARKMAENNTVMVIGDTAFVHGGLIPSHVAYGIDRINREVREFMLGTSRELPSLVSNPDSPVWHRAYAMAEDPAACALLGQTLTALGARRLVIGHTVQQQGANAACDGRVWRIDVGLSSHYGGPVQVLELREGQPPRVLFGTR